MSFLKVLKIQVILSAVFAVLSAVLLAFGIFFTHLPAKTEAYVSRNVAAVSAEGEDVTVDQSVFNQQPPSYQHVSADQTAKAMLLSPTADLTFSDQLSVQDFETKAGQVLDQMAASGVNTVYLPLNVASGVLYHSEIYPMAKLKDRADYDPLQFLLDAASKRNLRVVAVDDPLLSPQDCAPNSSKMLNPCNASDVELAQKALTEVLRYDPLYGLLLTNLSYRSNYDDYLQYMSVGGGQGYGSYKTQSLTDTVLTLAGQVKQARPGLYLGMQAGALWATAAQSAGGMELAGAPLSDLSRYSDTIAWAGSKLFDFVLVRSTTTISSGEMPFGKVADWWGGVSQSDGMDLYFLQNLDPAGWTGTPAYDEVTRQYQMSAGISGYRGTVFSSFGLFNSGDDPVMGVLRKMLAGSIDITAVFTDLKVTKPTSTKVTVYESVYTISGVSDPYYDLTINDQPVKRLDNGAFSQTYNLQIGNNSFVIKHKGQAVTYNIFRSVVVLKSVSPTDTVEIDGGSQMGVSVVAYKGSAVKAKIGTTTIDLTEDPQADETIPLDSEYTTFTGTYTAPAATNKDQKFTISFTGTFKGITNNKTGGTIVVRSLPLVPSSGQLVEVTDRLAEVFPITTANDTSVPVTSPLPKGTRDYAVGEVTYTSGSDRFVYYKLASGQRIYRSAVVGGKATVSGAKPVDGGLASNRVSSTVVSQQNGDTYVTVSGLEKVPFEVKPNGISFGSGYAVSGLNITYIDVVFNYTNLSNASVNFDGGRLFSSVEWITTNDKPTLRLMLKRTNCFFGLDMEYTSSNQLVLMFNNPPINNGNGRLDGVKIGLDPGHGYTTQGWTSGAPNSADPNVPEDDMNWYLTLQIKSKLEALGAQVFLSRSDRNQPYGTEDLYRRIESLVANKPDFYVAVHHNSSTSTNPSGPETYYFYPFSQPLAGSLFNSLSGLYTSNGRSAGRPANYHNFAVTRWWVAPSSLIEIGYLSNPDEAWWCMNNRDTIAQSVVNGICSYVNQYGS